MQVVEGVVAGGRLQPGVGERAEAVADFNAFEVKPPEQGGCIEHFQYDLCRRVGADALVVQCERLVVILRIDVEEREVPPVVVGKAAIRGPARRRLRQPRLSRAAVAAHFMNVGDGMHGPCVQRFQFDSGNAKIECAGIVPALLEAESRHAQNCMPSFISLAKSADRLQWPVAQLKLPAREEAAAMGVLQRQQVAWRVLRDPAECSRRFMQASLRPCQRGGEVRPLARIEIAGFRSPQ